MIDILWYNLILAAIILLLTALLLASRNASRQEEHRPHVHTAPPAEYYQAGTTYLPLAQSLEDCARGAELTTREFAHWPRRNYPLVCAAIGPEEAPFYVPLSCN